MKRKQDTPTWALGQVIMQMKDSGPSECQSCPSRLAASHFMGWAFLYVEGNDRIDLWKARWWQLGKSG